MDRFIFHNEQYKILDAVRDLPWAGAPLPFAECIFFFADVGLQVSTAICKNGTSLAMGFSQVVDGCLGAFCSADAALVDSRWPDTVKLSFPGRVGAPPDCIYEFIRFYQRLSVYLALPKPKKQITERGVRARDAGMSLARDDDDLEPKDREPVQDRIISLAPLSVEELRYYGDEDNEHIHKKQANPCTYSYWVRGHNRNYKSGVSLWIKPYMRNTKFPEQSKTYTLKEDG